MEEKQVLQGQLLKNQLLYTLEGLKPGNMIKNLYGKVSASPDLRGGLITTAIGLAAFYFTGRTVLRSPSIPLSKVFGSFIQSGVSDIIARRPKAIKSMGGFFNIRQKQDVKKTL